MVFRFLVYFSYIVCYLIFVLKVESYCFEVYMYFWNKIYIDKRKKIYIDELNKELVYIELVIEYMFGFVLIFD